MLNSDYKELCEITLPYKGRQMYMHSFDLSSPSMPKGYEDYLEIVIELCKSAEAFYGEAHMTVDEKIVKAGMSQRRPKPHVDGCFVKDFIEYIDEDGIEYKTMDWIHGPVPVRRAHWSHSHINKYEKYTPSWLHYCNNIQTENISRMSVIVASSVSGCKAWKGNFEAQPTPCGDLSHIEDKLGEGEILTPDKGYLLSPDCIHESMIFNKDTQRTFLRIALPLTFKYGE
jgi:hypothetical protein